MSYHSSSGNTSNNTTTSSSTPRSSSSTPTSSVAQVAPVVTTTTQYSSAGAFIPHTMYDPNTGQAYNASTEALHLEYIALGYVHEMPAREEEPTKFGETTVQLQIQSIIPVPSNFDSNGYPRTVTYGGVILTRTEESRKEQVTALIKVTSNSTNANYVQLDTVRVRAKQDDVDADPTITLGEEIIASTAADMSRRAPGQGMFMFGDSLESGGFYTRPHGYQYAPATAAHKSVVTIQPPKGHSLSEINNPIATTGGYGQSLSQYTETARDLNYLSIPVSVTNDETSLWISGQQTHGSSTDANLYIEVNYPVYTFADRAHSFSYMRDPANTDIEYKWHVSKVVYDEGTGTLLNKDPVIHIGSKASIDRAAIVVPTRDPEGTVTSADIFDKGQYNGTGRRTMRGLVYTGMNPPDIIVRVSQEAPKVNESTGKPIDIRKNDGGDAASKLALAAGVIGGVGVISKLTEGVTSSLTTNGLTSNLPALPKIDIDISKCIDITIPELAIDGALNNLKGQLDGAVNKAGLDKLMGKLDSLKKDVVSKVPPLPSFPDFASQLAALDPNNLEAVQLLKQRWGNIVSNIDDKIAGVKAFVSGIELPDFDICKLKEQEILAEIQPDGTYKEKIIATMPTLPTIIPIEDIPVSEQVITVEAADTAADEFQEKFSVTPVIAKSGLAIFKANSLAAFGTWFSLTHRADLEVVVADLKKLQGDKNYQAFLTARKTAGGVADFDTTEDKYIKWVKKEKDIFPRYYKLTNRAKLYNLAIKNLHNYVKANCSSILEAEDPGAWSDIIAGRIPRPLKAGSNITATSAIVTEEMYNTFMDENQELLLFIKRNLWKKIPVLGLARYYLASGQPGVTLLET